MDKIQKQNIERRQSKKNKNYRIPYLKIKNRENKSTMLDVRTVVTLGGRD